MTEDLAWLGSWLAAESVNGRVDVGRLPDNNQVGGQNQTRPVVSGQFPISSDVDISLGPNIISAPLKPSQSSNISEASVLNQASGQVSSSPQVSSPSSSMNTSIRPRPHSHIVASSPSTTNTARFGLSSIETSMHISRSASLDTAMSLTPIGGHSSSDELSPRHGHSNANSSFFSAWKKPSVSGTPDFSNTRIKSSTSQDLQPPIQHQRPEAAHDRSSSHRMGTTNAKINPDTLQRRRTLARQLLGPSSSTQVRSGDYIGSQDVSGRRSVCSSASASSYQNNPSRESPNSERYSWLGTRSAQEVAVSPSLKAPSVPSEGSHGASRVQQQTVSSSERRPISRSFSESAPAGSSERGPSYSGRDIDGHYLSFLEKGFKEGEMRRRVIIDGRLFEFEKNGRSLKIVENEMQERGIIYGSPESHGSSSSSPLTLNTHIYPPADQALSPLLPVSASSYYGDVYSIRGSIASSILGDVPDAVSPVIDPGQKSLCTQRSTEQDVANKSNIIEETRRPFEKEATGLFVEDSSGSLSSPSGPANQPSPRGPNQSQVTIHPEGSFEDFNSFTPQKAQAEKNHTVLSENPENPSETNPSGSPHSTVSSSLPTPPMLEDSTLPETKGYNLLMSPDQLSPSPSRSIVRPQHQHMSSTHSSNSWLSKQPPPKLMIPTKDISSSQPADDLKKRMSDERVRANFDPTIHSEKGRERGVVVEELYDSDEDDESLAPQAQSRQQQQYQHQLTQQQQSPQHQHQHQHRRQPQREKSKDLPQPPPTSSLIFSGHQSNEEPKYASTHVRNEPAPADPYEVLSRPMPKEYNTQDIWKKGVKKLGVIGALGKAATRKGTKQDRPPPTGALRNFTPTTPVYPKPSPGHTHFSSTHRGGHELSSAGVANTNDPSGSSPLPVHLDHQRRIHQEPLREAVSPIVHTGGQIAARANAIENEEERKLAENMFM
ncbi:hypothetical protein [Phaffia rhodozyma]|uniref:Uncharacterized protein n=1 Tax=Phaffia rhodozyma TaxID=264483 RepID=A0A0F7SR90_PHARH|nr:hypothetical protein [Phaffia rhodozyma]